MSELIDAVKNNDIEEVETLLNNNADPNFQDDDYEIGQGTLNKVDIMSPYHSMLKSIRF